MVDLNIEAGLKVVDAFDLDDELRGLLRPAEMLKDAAGRRHRLPRYFYEIPSHEAAMQIRLTQHFGLNEFSQVDIKEAARLQEYPCYIPCAVRLLAFFLQRVREQAGASMHVMVNGGYRSPSHKMSVNASPHMWGTAADLYRVGTVILKDQESIEKFGAVARDLTDDLFVMPYGHEPGTADDHLHLDLGYITAIPREISEDRMEVPQERPRFVYEERRRGDRRGQPPGDEVPNQEVQS